MSIFTPWRDAARLRRQLKDAETVAAHLSRAAAALRTEVRDLQVQLRVASMERDAATIKMMSMHSRDPKTGRILPKGQTR